MAAVFDRRFAGGAGPGEPLPSVPHRRLTIRAGLAAAALMSMLLHLAGLLPIGVGPRNAAVPNVGQPMLTRIIYADHEVPVDLQPRPSTESRPPDVAVALPTEAPAPAKPHATTMTTPRPLPARQAVAEATPAPAPGTRAPAPALASPAPAEARPTPVEPSPQASRTLPPAPDYASAATLDPPPRPLSDIDPDYPKSAGLRQGVVVLRLLIDAAGHVDNVAVVRSAPTGVFDESALAAFGKARFSPGMLLGVAVKSQWTVEVEFTPVNRGGSVAGRNY